MLCPWACPCFYSRPACRQHACDFQCLTPSTKGHQQADRQHHWDASCSRTAGQTCKSRLEMLIPIVRSGKEVQAKLGRNCSPAGSNEAIGGHAGMQPLLGDVQWQRPHKHCRGQLSCSLGLLHVIWCGVWCSLALSAGSHLGRLLSMI